MEIPPFEIGLLSIPGHTLGGTSFIINDKTKKIIMDGVEREVVEWRKEFITFHENEITKTISETTGNFPIIDRVTGYYSQKKHCTVAFFA